MLKQNSRPDLRVFIVWEPVISTDWGKPSPTLPGLVPDVRARHYYDPDRKLSARLGGVAKVPALAAHSEVGFRMKDVIWDAALLYEPSVTLNSQAALLLAPVVKFQARLADTLGANRRN